MASVRMFLVAGSVVALSACGGGMSDDPVTETTARVGESIGVADAIERTREVANQAEERANMIDDLAPSP